MIDVGLTRTFVVSIDEAKDIFSFWDGSEL
jgi:hypothetical protein